MTSLINRVSTVVRSPMAATAVAGRARNIPQQRSLPLHHQVREEERMGRHARMERTRRGDRSGSSCSGKEMVVGKKSGEMGTKMVVIVGATGTGKTKLSIDAAEALGGEVVNADKIQLYDGLDVTTNKVSLADRRGVPHHLLGAVRPDAGELPASSFRSLAAATAESIAARHRVPVVAGGSNSLIHALFADRFDASAGDPFSPSATGHYRPALRFPCCLLWVDVHEALLEEYLDRRVDDMVDAGMVEELREYFATTSASERATHAGLGKAIGVPELGDYFARRKSFRSAIDEIKANTRQLAAAQVGKIRRMADDWCWPIHRLDATGTVRARLAGAGSATEAAAWERDVRGPGLAAIQIFLGNQKLHSDANGNGKDAAEEELLLSPRMQCCDMVG